MKTETENTTNSAQDDAQTSKQSVNENEVRELMKCSEQDTAQQKAEWRKHLDYQVHGEVLSDKEIDDFAESWRGHCHRGEWQIQAVKDMLKLKREGLIAGTWTVEAEMFMFEGIWN